MSSPLRPLASVAVVFDTNVLVSAFVFKGKASAIYQHCTERYTLFTTEWMLDELIDVLSRAKFGLPVTVQNAILDQVRSDSQIIYPTNELPIDSADPDDNYVLQAALFVKAHFLITGDTRHLLPLNKVGTTEIISPSNFYERYVN